MKFIIVYPLIDPIHEIELNPPRLLPVNSVKISTNVGYMENTKKLYKQIQLILLC